MVSEQGGQADGFTGRIVATILAASLVAAIFLVTTGTLSRLPFPPPLFVVLGVAAIGIATALSPALRAWMMQADLRLFVGLHVTRFVGFFFLAAAARGDMMASFARKAGYGDITVAIIALVLLLTHLPVNNPARKNVVFLWNCLGLADILLVVLGAMHLALQDRAAITPFTQLPMGLFPTFLVPLVIVSHILIFARLRRINF